MRKKDLCNKQGRQAINLAEWSLRNDEERYNRSGGDVQVYKEITFTANQARRVVFELLREPEDNTRGEMAAQDQTFRSYSFRTTDQGTIELTAPIANFPVPNERKTIATLQRQSKYPLIAAMSGWSHSMTNVTVSGRDWTDEVMNISRVVKHQLHIDGQRDQGKPGQFFASHAEKQLLAYFVSKHVLIESEEQVLLREAKPPVLLKGATILASRIPCTDCLQYIDAVNSAFDLRILVLDRG